MNRFYALKIFIIPFLFVFACGTKKTMVDRLNEIKDKPEKIAISNQFAVNNEDGHIQGVQLFKHKKKDYYFFTGSSNDQSYLAIADIKTKKIIAIDELLSGDFRHAGGFQIADDLLAVGIEDNIKVDKSKVQIYQIIDPKKGILKLLKTIERNGREKRYTAGCVAILKQRKNIIVAVGNWDTKDIDFYAIPTKELKKKTSNFKLIYSFNTEQLNPSDWIEPTWNPYQSINFISNSKKEIYLLGTTGNDSTKVEFIDLFKVDAPDWKNIELQKVAFRKFSKPEGSTFKWGGGVYWNKKEGMNLFSTGRNIEDSLKVGVYGN